MQDDCSDMVTNSCFILLAESMTCDVSENRFKKISYIIGSLGLGGAWRYQIEPGNAINYVT